MTKPSFMQLMDIKQLVQLLTAASSLSLSILVMFNCFLMNY